MAITESVKIVFEVDNSVLQSTVDKLVALNKISQEDAASFKALSDASKAAGASMSQAAKGANDLATAEKKVAKASSEVAISAKGLKTVADELKATSASAASASEAFVPLKKQVREAKLELEQLEEQFGATSQQAFEARERVGALTARLDDLNRQTKLIEPEDKIKAFTALGQSVVGAFSVATGALQAFGAENEEVQKIAQKLQGALNIVQGLQSIIQLKEAYEDIRAVLGFTTAAQTALTTAQTTGTIATNAGSVAMRGFAAALSSTGIGAIVVALGALAGAFLLASNNAGEAATKSQALLDLEKEFIGLSDKRAEAELKIRVAKGEITQDQADAILLQKELNTLTEDQGKKLEDFRAKNATIIQQYETFVAAGNEADFFEVFDEDAADVIAQLKQLEDNKVEANRAADAQILADQAQTLAKQKEQAKDAAKKATEEAKKNAKEAEEARLKALQDNQANIDAQNAATAALRQQYEQELASQLGDIDKVAQQRRLENQIIFFGDQAAISEENLQDEIKQAQDRADKIAEFYGVDSEAYKAELEKKRLLELQFGKLVVDNRQKTLNEANAAALVQNQIDATSAEDLLKRNNKTQEQYLRASVALYKEGTDERAKAEQNLALFLKQLGDQDIERTKKNEQEKAQLQKERIDRAFQLSNQATELIIEANQRQNEEEIASLEEKREKGLITEEAYEIKLKQLKRKSAEDAKKAQVFQATMNAAQAILSALATFYPDPATKISAVAFAAAVSALNLAKVIATPIPKFKQGTLAVPGYDTGDDSVMAMLRPGEAVIPTETNREYSAIIRSIYKREIPASEFNEFLANRNQPVFDFNKVTLDALFKRDIKVSSFNNSVVKRTGGDMPTLKVKADVDTYQLSRAMAKNKAVELSNSEVLAKALAQEIAKTQNIRRQ